MVEQEGEKVFIFPSDESTDLEAIKTSVQIMDDWDESDRAKVNTIVGQAGVEAGAGTTTVKTQRVVLVTDQTQIPVVPNRPSQGTGRVYKEGTAANLAVTNTLYTVTVGKTLYITSIEFSGYNTSAVAAGNIQIRDSATIKVPMSFPTAGVGAVASIIQSNVSSLSFPEPIQFSTNFNVTIVTGTITYSCSFRGYEE